MKSFANLILLAALLVQGIAAFQPLHSRTKASSALFMSEAKQTGTVKWFNTLKGYGFIVPDSGGSDIFVHQTEIQAEGFRSLADGESVEFDIKVDDNGKTKATSVTGPGGAPVQGAPFRPSSDDYAY